jgi:hypothetical protein
MFFRKARAAQGDEAVHSPFGSTALNTAQAQEDHSMSNPGPQNLGLVRLNPNGNRPPPTDQGSVGSIWHSFDMTHRRVQEGGWSHQGIINSRIVSSETMRKQISIFTVFTVLTTSMAIQAGPVSLPPVNLGETSFEDGIANPGWLFEQTIECYHANQFTDSGGAKVSGKDELTTVSTLTHLAYFSKCKLLGGYVGTEFLVPLVDVDLEASFQPHVHEQGVGDMIINPLMLQWNDRDLFGKPFSQRFDFQMVFPTGKYNSDRALNIGNHVISLDPYYACTFFPSTKLELSARLHYLWNSENDNPYEGLHASSIQPGQAFHANFATSYEMLKRLRIGINGYALQQLTDDRINGNSLAHSEERVFGIGPGLVYNQNKLWITLNNYFETGARNRPEGIGVVLRISLAF